MLLPDSGPVTSLMEDLAGLGLAEKSDMPAAKSVPSGQPDEKGGDYAGPPNATGDDKEGSFVKGGDAAAGHRTDVPVRKDTTTKGTSKAEDEDYEDEQVEDNSSGKLVPSFMIPTEQEVAEAEQIDENQAEDEKLKKAWEVVNSYFAENNDGLNEAGLRGVINAMGFALNVCVEDIAGLTEANAGLVEEVNHLRAVLSESDDEDEDDKKSDDDSDDEESDEDGDDEEKDKEKVKKLPPWLQGKKMGESRRAKANLTESDDLTSIADEIKNIGATESREARAVGTQAKLIEGFEKVAGTSREICGRVAQVIADEAGLGEGETAELDPADQRVQIGAHFESIANDAERYLARLADGDVPFKVAHEDLQRLQRDMEKGMTAMREVE